MADSTGQIRIKIGAALDRSVNETFGAFESRAKKARSTVLSDQQRAAKQGSQAETTAAKASAKAQDDFSKAAARAAKEMVKEHTAASKAMVKAEQSSARERGKIEAEVSRDIIRGFKQQVAEANKAQQEHERSVDRFATRTSHRAVRFLFPNPTGMIGAAGRIGGEIARGAGVDTSVGSLVQRGVGIESAAIALSNRGHIEGTPGANGQVVAHGALEGEARAAGLATAVNPEEILNAGKEFVGLTGDLDLWRKIMPDVVKQTAALGGNQEDAAKAAGEFAAHVGDIPNKEKAILDLMSVAAGQGKIGGMDFSEFAKYAAKAAAPAAQFAGDKAHNIGKLTALAEIAKMHGGAPNAATAFTGISSFVNTLKKPARLKSIAALTGDANGQFTDSTHSQFKDVDQIIKSLILGASKDAKGHSGLASLTKVSAAVGDARAMLPITGLMNTFNEAGGGSKGMAAVEAELAKFNGAVMSSAEVQRANAEQLQSTRAKAELFNQRLEALTHDALEKLLPALEKLEGPAIGVANAFAGIVEWAATNPGEAIVAAIVLAITRAGLESAFRGAIESAIKGSGPGGGGAGGVGALLSGGGGYSGVRGAINSPLGGMLAAGAAVAGVGAAVSQYSSLSDEVGNTGSGKGTLEAIWNVVSGNSDKVANVSKATTPEEYDAIMAKHLGRELRVRITNPNDIKSDPSEPPGVDPRGRAPDP